MAKLKTWQEKMDKPASPETKILEKGFQRLQPGDTILIPTPRLIEAFLNQLKPGETASVVEMREALARDHGAELTCPLTTGMFLRTVSEASLDPDSSVQAPFWRLVDPSSPLAKKLSCGPEWIVAKRSAEV